ncbi:MaoC family dehydratase [Faecalibaculum rodentium]|uniref:MaoC family dehydratase n=1 Tax=Faecalibaculum rodentium TaxID=1702221 RepID=UPI0026708E00|nr:MaoC family dehydratase [Faecalibaculum rodentium]
MVLKIGQSESFSKTISESDVYNFAGITGDFNSAHVNKVAAENGLFGERVAHGMLTASLISTVLGTRLPGPGTIYLGQNLNFKRPVFFGDTVTATATVTEILNDKKGTYKLETVLTNQNGEIVTDGFATVLYREEQGEKNEKH